GSSRDSSLLTPLLVEGRRAPEGGRSRDCWKEAPDRLTKMQWGCQRTNPPMRILVDAWLSSTYTDQKGRSAPAASRGDFGAASYGISPRGTGSLTMVVARTSYQGARCRAVMWMSRHRSCFPVSPAREEIAAGDDANALPTDREPWHCRQHAQRRSGQP